MTNADPKVVDSLNSDAELRFTLEVRRNDANQKFKDAKAALESTHAAKLAEIEAEIEQVDARIRSSAETNRAQLIERGRKSFATMAAKFQFRKPPEKLKVKDAKAILQVARQLGIVRKIGVMSIVWKLDMEKFLEWLGKNGEHRRHFEPYLEEPSDKQSLTIKPNSNYTVFHDSKRISPPSITIKG